MPETQKYERFEPYENPMGTDGFEFVEYCSPNPEQLAKDFESMGFSKVGKHRSKDVYLYRQGEINFIVNNEPNSFASEFAKAHGPSACAMAFRVKDARFAFDNAIKQGAKAFTGGTIASGELEIPVIYGIGDSLLYFVDEYTDKTIYDTDFEPIGGNFGNPVGVGLTYIDHLTHNMNRGQMDVWYSYYQKLFNFREIRFFDIQGQLTGLISRALTSPCGKIRIPLNESTDDKSQIEEFIADFKGEGIQHIALGTDDIYDTIEIMRGQSVDFMSVPDAYYEMIRDRVPWHDEDEVRLHKNFILLDGAPTPEGGLLLQIFTDTMLGPVFFEIIQRKGNEGFGEGNFQALFDSIERDQIRRGVLKQEDATSDTNK